MTLPPGLSQNWLKCAVETTFQETLLGDLVNVEVKPLSVDPSNFTSEVKRIKMIFTNGKSRKRELMLIVKVNKVMETDSEEMEAIVNNKTEIVMYDHVLKHMEILMAEFDDRRGLLWPKLYGQVPYSVLLLQDLEDQMYFVKYKSSWLDEEHSFLTLRSLGRFHAMSKILIKRGIIGEEYRNVYALGKKNPHQEKCLQGTLHLLAKIMMRKGGRWKSEASSEEWGRLWNKQKPFVSDKMDEAYMNYDKRFEVLNHGDFRSSNIVYKTIEYTNRPSDVKFFDFQLTHINSFIWDIIYLFSLSIDPDFRRKNRTRLLEAYQQSLSDNLKFFGWDGYIPTRDDVHNEATRMAFVEFIFMACITPVVTSVRDKAYQMDKVASHPPEEVFDEELFGDDYFVDAIVDDFKRVVALKLI